MKLHWLAVCTALAVSNAAPASPAPSSPGATLIRSSEIQAAVKQHDEGTLSDSVLRVVPVGSNYNIAVAVVRRSHTQGHMPPDALVHDAVTEVYQVIEGKGILVTGGKIQSSKPITDAAVLDEIGPSSAGQSIVGGAEHHVGPGDVIVIPAGTPHGFIAITTPRIVYTIIRVDAQKVLRDRDETR